MKLPVIDMSDLKQGTPRWESAKAQVRKAFEEYGCFEALYDQIPQRLRKSLLDGIKATFDLPLEIKLRNRPDKPYHGYVGQIPEIPLYESMGIEDVLSPGNVDSFTTSLWSEGNPSFSKSLRSYSEQLCELDKNVRKMVLESLELEKYMDEHIESTNYLLRFQKYDAPHGNENKLGLAPHSDKNIVTIVHQNEVDGLEIMSKAGQWSEVKLSHNSYLVSVGDSFHAWTNGALHSLDHRVMMKGDVPRYSIGLFSTPKIGCIIEAPEELVDEEHPRLFKPYDFVKLLNFYYSGTENHSLQALNEFCDRL